MTNQVLVITRWKVLQADVERLERLSHLKLTVLVTWSGIDDRRIEPVNSGAAEASLRTLAAHAERTRTILYWRPLIAGVNDTDAHLARARSLVGERGKCRGSARLTLVSTPPVDARFGSEFVRVNVDAALQQEDFDHEGRPRWKGRLDPIYLPDQAGAAIEAERIEHGLKWSPVKAFAKTMPMGVGKSSNWRMFLSYLTRAGEQMPADGVPFTVLLRLSDPKGDAPVFNDMRQTLTALGARVDDIRTAARVATRI